MAFTPTDNSQFFGMDLSQWPRQWRAAGAALLDLPMLRWLVPTVPVRLRRLDGQTSDWGVARGLAIPAAQRRAGVPAVDAIQLPSDRVLERQLMLPPLTPSDIEQAVQLEVGSTSPFGPGQTVHGFSVAPEKDGVCRVDVAITSRQQVEQALQAAGADAGGQVPEVWVLTGDAAVSGTFRPVVLRGFGEGARRANAQRGLAWRGGLVVLALMLLALVVVTPTALLRMQAQQAAQSFAALQRQAAPQIAQREALMQRVERLRAIGQITESQLALAPVLDMLTRAVPDGAWVNQLRMEGHKVVLQGNADDAAALVQKLAAQSGVRDVRLASPATRGHNASKETFIIEMNLDAGRYGLARNARSAS